MAKQGSTQVIWLWGVLSSDGEGSKVCQSNYAKSNFCFLRMCHLTRSGLHHPLWLWGPHLGVESWAELGLAQLGDVISKKDLFNEHLLCTQCGLSTLWDCHIFSQVYEKETVFSPVYIWGDKLKTLTELPSIKNIYSSCLVMSDSLQPYGL